MGVQQLREAFDAACNGKAKSTALQLRYDHALMPNGQVLEISGKRADGSDFALVSEVFAPQENPTDVAQALARTLTA